MKWRTMRLVLDFLLVGMLVFEMFYMFTGNVLHEVVGVVFFVTLAIHMVFGRKWVAGIRSRAVSAGGSGVPVKQKVKVGICVALVVMFALLLVSSVLISNILSSVSGWVLSGNAYSSVAFAHMVCAYAVCAFTIGHIGLHWISLFKALRIPYDPSRRRAINAGVMTMASLSAVAVGLAATKEVASWTGLAEMVNESTESERTVAEAASESGARNEEGSASSASSNGRQRAQSGSDRSSRNSNGSQSNNGPFGSSTNDSSGSGSARSGSAESAVPNSSSNSSSNDGSANTTSTICTLCHKRCPLSAPKCNKPYAAGLI